ncbi:MAG: hypothetical protein ACOYXB_03720 [Bacteroidota bacterium]
MKRILILLLAVATTMSIYAQPDTSRTVIIPENEEFIEEPEISAVPEVPEMPALPEKTRVSLGQNEILIFEENGDTTRVKLGSQGFSLVEGEDGTTINIVDMEENQDEADNDEGDAKKDRKKFKPHYAGFDLGLNGYLSPGYEMALPAGSEYMNLNTGLSWNFNWNFIDYGFGFGTDKVGLVTGLGLEWTNYVFDGQNSIAKDVNGVIGNYIPDNADAITKSKLGMFYLKAPLFLEFHIPVGGKDIHISGGLTGGIKLSSKTKIKYLINGERSKENTKGDYNLSPLRYGAEVRIGYRALNLYATYYLTPLFEKNMGPELYPFTIGLTLIDF